MAAETIQPLKTISFFTDARPQKRDKEKTSDFARWLADQPAANTDLPVAQTTNFTAALSREDVLILAQAQEEEYALAAHAYQVTAQSTPDDIDQLTFDFFPLEIHSGDVMDQKI